MSWKSRFLDFPIILWIMANLTGLVIFLAVVNIFRQVYVSGTITTILTILTITIPFSAMQWIVLRSINSITWLWIFSFPGGVLLAWLFYISIPYEFWYYLTLRPIIGMVVFPLIFGSLIGLPQWLLLRGKLVRAVLWLPATSMAFFIGFILIQFTNIYFSHNIIFFILFILIYAISTGVILTGLIDPPGSQQTVLGDDL